ncbi:hypothetical protein Daura_23170 [Dactylosporangium aurantiacum]|uniref:Uncharacterized protein n=1 Tax=Dactylosporangium aurantiacum TaxID=35754 RepID=A0A9Q9MRT0_9ACTN|nr:hypothetical protein [Dactylosporangium aurantiacum]MDG6104012.1 hypothetical protein [Dactylosporangium aurantiacum]UWZ58812.1 hypothetical protein Daura_23170 [Dactylosporangium aurantiacum]
MGGFLLGEVFTALVKMTMATLGHLWGLLAATAYTTPDVTTLPQVTTISNRLLLIVNASFGLAILAAAVMVMGRETVQSRYGLAELGPRLVIGWIAANFAAPICGWMIGFGNSVTVAVTGASISPERDLRQLTAVLTACLSSQNDALLTAVIAMILVVLTGMLLATWIIRIGTLVVVVSVAPLALACHATPFTDGAARLWWRSFGVLLGTVTAQALALHVTLSVLLDPAANLPGMMLPKDPTGNGTVNLLIIVCLLWATLRIPALLRRGLGGGRQQSVVGVVLRMAVMQKLTGALRLPLRALGVGRAGRRLPVSGGGAGRSGVASAVLPYWRLTAPRPLPSTAPRRDPSSGPSSRAGGRTGSSPSPGGGGSGARGATPASRPAAAAPRLPVPPGVNPATAMPRRRPAWQARTPPARPGRPTS